LPFHFLKPDFHPLAHHRFHAKRAHNADPKNGFLHDSADLGIGDNLTLDVFLHPPDEKGDPDDRRRHCKESEKAQERVLDHHDRGQTDQCQHVTPERRHDHIQRRPDCPDPLADLNANLCKGVLVEIGLILAQ